MADRGARDPAPPADPARGPRYFAREQPLNSGGRHLADIVAPLPEAPSICEHDCGGEEWECTIKALQDAPSAYTDASGSVTDERVIEMVAGRRAGCSLAATCLWPHQNSNFSPN